MLATVRILTALAVLSLLTASSVHFGLIIEGYAHQEAAVAEAVIGVVMLVLFPFSWARPPWSRRAAQAALGVGLLGTLVGVFTIVIGVGPQTTPDIIYHALLVVVLVVGLVLTRRIGR